MTKRIRLLPFLILFLSFGVMQAQTSSPQITVDEIKAHVKYLASDELEGRGSGSKGNEKAAAYLASQLKSYGVKPAGDSGTYMQEFEFISSVRLGEGNSLTITTADRKKRVLKLNDEFRPFGFSSNKNVTGDVVFAGYGITSQEKNYDDFAGIDVTDKVVIALRFSPDGNDPHSEFNRHTAFRNKARIARDKGAKALILVTGPNDESEDALITLAYDNAFANSGIVAISMKRAVLDDMLQGTELTTEQIQDSIKSSRRPFSFAMNGVAVEIASNVEKVMSRTSNVVGVIKGRDAALNDQALVIGAHFDHLGYGGVGSGSLVPDQHEIHNGADDNASGTAAMLELAQKFSAHPPARTLVFVGFSGEEMGTLGSAHYVANPFHPLEKTIAMINMDEVGRLNNDALTIYGMGTSPEWANLVKKHNTGFPSPADTFALRLVPDGFGPSDHAQFYGKNIPVLFFFTGTHGDYHRPSDDWNTLNYEGEERVVRYIYSIADDIQRSPEKPVFAKTQSTSPMGGGDTRGFTVTLGVIPDYGEGSEGMKIGGTRPNGPAEKAGMKSGDIIVRMGTKKVLNIYDYMGVLGELKSGDVVEVEVKRDGKPMTFTVTMQRR